MVNLDCPWQWFSQDRLYRIWQTSGAIKTMGPSKLWLLQELWLSITEEAQLISSGTCTDIRTANLANTVRLFFRFRSLFRSCCHCPMRQDCCTPSTTDTLHKIVRRSHNLWSIQWRGRRVNNLLVTMESS